MKVSASYDRVCFSVELCSFGFIKYSSASSLSAVVGLKRFSRIFIPRSGIVSSQTTVVSDPSMGKGMRIHRISGRMGMPPLQLSGKTGNDHLLCRVGGTSQRHGEGLEPSGSTWAYSQV